MPPSRFPIFRLAAIVLLAAASAAAQAEQPAAAPVRAPFPQLAWKIDRRVADARKVFVSPVDPAIAYVATDSGLVRTTDGGGAWTPVARTTPAEVGTVTALAVCPAEPEFAVLGTAEKGILLSTDGGLTWRPGGGVSSGLSGPYVRSVMFFPMDRGWQTLLAWHDVHAPGISKSVDGGRTWRVLASNRYFRSLVGMGPVLLASAAKVDEPDSWHIARSTNYGETWNVVERGGQPEGAAVSMLPPRVPVFATSAAGLLVSDEYGTEYKAARFPGAARWETLFTTAGRTPGEQWFWAYDPFRRGLVCGYDFDRFWEAKNRGLFVDRMIRQGAVVAASGDGTRFYACVNGMLYAGEHETPEAAPVIRMARTTPASLWIRPAGVFNDSREMVTAACVRISEGARIDEEIAGIARNDAALRSGRGPATHFDVQVRVEHPKGPEAVTSVTVTPDLLGLGKMPLFDDGKHNDGAAADGLWGGGFDFDEGRMLNANGARNQGRWAFPGTRGMPVTAIDADGNQAEWTMMLSVFVAPESSRLVSGGGRYDVQISDAAKAAGKIVADKTIRDLRSLEVTGKSGPWHVLVAGLDSGNERDITGLKYVRFRLRGQSGSGDVSFFLVDELSMPVDWGRDTVEPQCFSRAVPLLAGKYVPAMDGRSCDVRIPIAELVHNVRFMRRHVVGFGLRAAEGAPGGNYQIDDVWLTHD